MRKGRLMIRRYHLNSQMSKANRGVKKQRRGSALAVISTRKRIVSHFRDGENVKVTAC